MRTKVLTALLKTVSYLSPEDLKEVIKVRLGEPRRALFTGRLQTDVLLPARQTVPLASLLGSIMSSRDNPNLTLGTLQLIELLTSKLPDVYKTGFRREGVMFEVEALADEDLTTAKATKKPATPAITPAVVKSEPQEAPTLASLSSLLDDAAAGANAAGAAPAASSTSTLQVAGRRPSAGTGSGLGAFIQPVGSSGTSSSKRVPSLPLDLKDANVLRARVIRFHALSETEEGGHEDAAAGSLKHMRGLVERLNDEEAGEVELRAVLTELAALFTSPDGGLSSFELLKGGLVDGLLECSTINGKGASLDPFLSRSRSCLPCEGHC